MLGSELGWTLTYHEARGYRVASSFSVHWHWDSRPPQTGVDYNYTKFSDIDESFANLHICGRSPYGSWTTPGIEHTSSQNWLGQAFNTSFDVSRSVTVKQPGTPVPAGQDPKAEIVLSPTPQLVLHFHRDNGGTFTYTQTDQTVTLPLMEDTSCPPLP